MQYDTQDNRLGGGIITVCVLHIIGVALSIIAIITAFSMRNKLKGIKIETSSLILPLIITIVLFIGVILILCKLKLGIILYYIAVIANLATALVLGSFTIRFAFTALILPILMGLFLKDKKELFGFRNR